MGMLNSSTSPDLCAHGLVFIKLCEDAQVIIHIVQNKTAHTTQDNLEKNSFILHDGDTLDGAMVAPRFLSLSPRPSSQRK